MKSKNQFLKWLAVLLVIIGSSIGAMAQVTQSVCLGTKSYQVNNTTAGSALLWTVSPGDPGVDWTITNNTSASTDIVWLKAGDYTVTFRETNTEGCYVDKTASVTIKALPTAGITNNTGTTVLTCTTGTINVTATGGATYSWSDGTNVVGTNAALAITAPGTYTVTVTSANGCTDTEVITITQDNTAPTAGITNNTNKTVLTCTTGTINVTATGGGTYSWSDGTNVVGTNAALAITAPGTYTVTVTSANGCTDTEVITITQDNTAPTAGITNNTNKTVLTCTTGTINVTATGGVTYSWSDGTNVVGTNAALAITAPGTYTVTVTSANGCTDTEVITITEDKTAPTAGITNNTGTTVLTCTTGTINVTATGGGTYSWSKGATNLGTDAALAITTPGTYTVTVTSANGCTDTEVINITQDDTAPTAGITNNTGTTVLTCTTGTINVTATGGGTYSWSKGATNLGTDAALAITTPGTYTVTVTSANGCTDTESITITENVTLPAAITSVDNKSTVCDESTLDLDNATAGGTWSSANNTIATVDPATGVVTGVSAGTVVISYTLTATGCKVTKTITVAPLPNPSDIIIGE